MLRMQKPNRKLLKKSISDPIGHQRKYLTNERMQQLWIY